MAESKITVHINARDLEVFRELVERAERAERAAENVRVLSSLRLPLPLRETAPHPMLDDLNREREAHFATKIALRDALRDAAGYATELASYAASYSPSGSGDEDAAEARADAERFDAARVALGLDEVTMPQAPAAGS